MTDAQQKAAAKQFVKDWIGRGYEKGDSQPFWLTLLWQVYSVENPTQFISFEDQIMLDYTSFIDGHIPSTHVLIEQMGIGKDLKKPIKQNDKAVMQATASGANSTQEPSASLNSCGCIRY